MLLATKSAPKKKKIPISSSRILFSLSKIKVSPKKKVVLLPKKIAIFSKTDSEVEVLPKNLYFLR